MIKRIKTQLFVWILEQKRYLANEDLLHPDMDLHFDEESGIWTVYCVAGHNANRDEIHTALENVGAFGCAEEVKPISRAIIRSGALVKDFRTGRGGIEASIGLCLAWGQSPTKHRIGFTVPRHAFVTHAVGSVLYDRNGLPLGRVASRLRSNLDTLLVETFSEHRISSDIYLGPNAEPKRIVSVERPRKSGWAKLWGLGSETEEPHECEILGVQSTKVHLVNDRPPYTRGGDSGALWWRDEGAGEAVALCLHQGANSVHVTAKRVDKVMKFVRGNRSLSEGHCTLFSELERSLLS